jgi:hypothetical protein
MFTIKNCLKQGDALLPLLFNFALEYAIRRVSVNQDGLKFSGTHTGDVSILAGSVHTIKKNVEALIVASKEIGLEILRTWSCLEIRMRDSHNTKIDNSFEKVEEFKYLGTTLMDQNSIQEEIRSRYKSGNTCYRSVQNRLSSSLLSNNTKIKIYRIIILPFVLYGCETWSFTLREEID